MASDPPTLDAMIAGFGKRTARTLLREADPSLSADDARQLEDALVRAATLWKHKTLALPALQAALIAEALGGGQLARHLSALERAPAPGPAHRAVTLAMFIVASSLDLDDGVAVPSLNREALTRGLVAWIVRRFGFTVGDMDRQAADALWAELEIDPDGWAPRIERLTRQYEKEKYGV